MPATPGWSNWASVAFRERTILMVPGYNEPPAHFDILCSGRNGIAGMRDYGFECLTFPQHDDTLGDRIDRFANHIDQMKDQGYAFPIALLGYSLGGLVVRGFLRRFPHRADEISHTVMIATPNWGVVTLALPHITRMLRIPDRAMGDMNLGSPFMQWLNGTGGHWKYTNDRRHRDWVLDKEPWIKPEGTKMLTIMGLIPERGGDNDGLVWGDSATLGSRIPAHYIVGPHANHMNVIGHFDPFIMLSKGFLANDRVWSLALQATLRFLGAKPLAVTPASQTV
ncbi:MAG: lipase family alpha/beta hydrolase [Vulcanimicrobiaceae bacterium]